MTSLRDFTTARVALGRTGAALLTRDHLDLQAAHARAREAVRSELDTRSVSTELSDLFPEPIFVRSAAADRQTYLRRPDLGRKLAEHSRELLGALRGRFDAVFMIADGLSATGVQLHAAGTIRAVLQLLPASDWQIGPLVFVEQGRVAIGDPIAELLGAAVSVVLIGERPGLSAWDSLGIYLTWNPHEGMTDAERNCISNIRLEGLSYGVAAHKLAFLMNESRRLRFSGIALKENAPLLEESQALTSLSD